MKTTQYVRQEKAIVAADRGGIRERWLWGLRLLRDTEKIAPAGGLKHGVAEGLIAAAKAAGLKLSASEIRARLACARAYPTEDQISRSTVDFEYWSTLVQANFPTYEPTLDETPAGHRDAQERARDARRQLARLADDEAQGTLFPLDRYEPSETPLKDLREYMEQQEEITARFVEHGQKRRAYYNRLEIAADGDLSMSWQEAHERLADDETEGEVGQPLADFGSEDGAE